MSSVRSPSVGSFDSTVFSNIFSFCEHEVLLQMERVNKCFYGIVNEEMHWQQRAATIGIDPNLPKGTIARKLLFRRAYETRSLGMIRRFIVKDLDRRYGGVKLSLASSDRKIILPFWQTKVGIFDLQSEEIIELKQEDSLVAPSFTCGDGKVFIAGGTDGNLIKIWDLQSKTYLFNKIDFMSIGVREVLLLQK